MESNQPLSPFPYYSKASGAILKGKTTKNCACLCLANSRAVRHKINIARQVFRQPPRTTQGELERKESRGTSICTSCSAQHKIGCYLRRAAATFKTAQARLGASPALLTSSPCWICGGCGVEEIELKVTIDARVIRDWTGPQNVEIDCQQMKMQHCCKWATGRRRDRCRLTERKREVTQQQWTSQYYNKRTRTTSRLVAKLGNYSPLTQSRTVS